MVSNNDTRHDARPVEVINAAQFFGLPEDAQALFRILDNQFNAIPPLDDIAEIRFVLLRADDDS